MAPPDYSLALIRQEPEPIQWNRVRLTGELYVCNVWFPECGLVPAG